MMQKDKILHSSIGEIVANDFRAASVFREAGIDFCCGGKKNLDQACNEKNVNPAVIIDKLDELNLIPDNSNLNFKEWKPGFLCDYIVNTHHKHVMKMLPELVGYTKKIASVHGENHKELIEVADLFSQISLELTQHMKKEEEVLFPAIKKITSNGSSENKMIVKSVIERLSGEHESAGGAMDKINEITNNYSVPADGCNTYQVTFKLLQQFEDDLHNHVHLENNILFPNALESAS